MNTSSLRAVQRQRELSALLKDEKIDVAFVTETKVSVDTASPVVFRSTECCSIAEMVQRVEE